MKRLLWLARLCAIGILSLPAIAVAGHSEYDALIAKHAKANAVPVELVHRVIVRESRYRPELIGHGGTIGLMQIKLATARGLGYTGDAEGLRDPDTNLSYGVKYLAGAWRVANGDHDRAMHYFATGYYYAAKQQRLERERLRQSGLLIARAPPKQAAKLEMTATAIESATPPETTNPEKPAAKQDEAAKPTPATATPVESVTPADAAAKPAQAALPKHVAATPNHIAVPPKQASATQKAAREKLADAEARVPRPPTSILGGANGTRPR